MKRYLVLLLLLGAVALESQLALALAAVAGQINGDGVPVIRREAQSEATQAIHEVDLPPVSTATPNPPSKAPEDAAKKDQDSEEEPEEVFPPGLLKFQDADLDQVLEIYQQLTDRTVLRPAALPSVKITLRSQTPLTRTEAIQLVDSSLALNGIIMIPQGEKTVKAVLAPQATSEALAFTTRSAEDLPESGSFVAQVVRVRHRPPRELAQALQPLAKTPQAILAMDQERILVLRDHAANVKRMLELIEILDAAPERATAKKGGAVWLYILFSLSGLLLYRPLLGWSLSRAWPVWLGSALIGFLAVFSRFPQEGPALASGPRSALRLIGGGLLFMVLVPVVIRFYRKWVGGDLTEQEQAPGAPGVRAWLEPVNVVSMICLALFAWLGFGFSFWITLLLLLLSLCAYPLLTSPMESGQVLDAIAAERSRALKLLEEGTITARECSNLLHAISRTGRARSGVSWLAGPAQKLSLTGGILVLVGFFLPWLRAAGDVGPVSGGDLGHALGWLVLLFAAIPVLLSYVLEPKDPPLQGRLSLLSLGAGTVILLYLLTTQVGSLGIGFFLAFTGYALAWSGIARQAA